MQVSLIWRPAGITFQRRPRSHKDFGADPPLGQSGVMLRTTNDR